MAISLRGAALGISCLTAFLGGCGGQPVVVQSGGAMAQQGLVATGTGEAKGAPDIARTTIGVEVRAESAEQATAQATQRMTAVIEALKATGIAPADLQTQNYSVNFEQEPQPPTPLPQGADKAAPVRGWYRASNMVEATIRDLSKVGAVLARATEAGANNVWGIAFELAHPEALMAQARAKAMDNAKQTAADLAKLSGVKLGALVSVSESGGGMPMPMMKQMAEVAQQDAPVETGQITTTVQVQLVYALPE
jgi:uncharacterized protein YggE